MVRLTLLGSILLAITGGVLHVYFNVWYAAYYYPDRYEDAIVLSTLAPLLVVGGLAGATGAGIVLWRARR